MYFGISIDWINYNSMPIIYKLLMKIISLSGMNDNRYPRFRNNILTLGKYLTKYNYKQKYMNDFKNQFMDIQELLIIDNELDLYKRVELELIIEELILELIANGSVLNELEYFNNLDNTIIKDILNIYKQIFKKLESDNYLTEDELEDIIKTKGK